MSEPNESQEYEEDMDVNDEESTEGEYDYNDDYYDDEHFDGFLQSNAKVDTDLTHDQIMNYLRIGIDGKQSDALATELCTMAAAGLSKQIAEGVVEFVCECPPSNVELVQRFQSVQALIKVWHQFSEFVTAAINDILHPEKPVLNRIPSRNLANFIRVLVDENIIDKDKLLIATTRETALPDPYLERLHQVLYNHYGYGNPLKASSKSILSSILPWGQQTSSSSSVTNAASNSTQQTTDLPPPIKESTAPSMAPITNVSLPKLPPSTSASSGFVDSFKKFIGGGDIKKDPPAST